MTKRFLLGLCLMLGFLAGAHAAGGGAALDRFPVERVTNLPALLSIDRALNFALHDVRNPDVLSHDSVTSGCWSTARTGCTCVTTACEVTARSAACRGDATRLAAIRNGNAPLFPVSPVFADGPRLYDRDTFPDRPRAGSLFRIGNINRVRLLNVPRHRGRNAAGSGASFRVGNHDRVLLLDVSGDGCDHATGSLAGFRVGDHHRIRLVHGF